MASQPSARPGWPSLSKAIPRNPGHTLFRPAGFDSAQGRFDRFGDLALLEVNTSEGAMSVGRSGVELECSQRGQFSFLEETCIGHDLGARRGHGRQIGVGDRGARLHRQRAFETANRAIVILQRLTQHQLASRNDRSRVAGSLIPGSG